MANTFFKGVLFQPRFFALSLALTGRTLLFELG